jgi:TonB family protein
MSRARLDSACTPQVGVQPTILAQDSGPPLHNHDGTQPQESLGGAQPPSGSQDGTTSNTGTGPYRVGDGVTAPVPLYRPEPEYSEKARNANYQGTVILYVEVDASGHPRNLKVLRSLGLGLDEKAIEAVEKWKFRPGYKDGHPVAVAASIEVNFRLASGVVTGAPATLAIEEPSGDEPLGAAEELVSGKGTIITPGENKHSYSATKIDARSFQYGGTLTVHISVGEGKDDGSFHLFREHASLDFEGDPTDHGSLAHRYVASNATATLTYQFQRGDIFLLAAEGRGLSRRKARNTYAFVAKADQGIGPLLRAGASLAATAAGVLEKDLLDKPDDLAARAKLISYYSGPPAITDADSAKAGRARHLLWMVEHHPETALLGYGRLCTINIAAEPLPDKEAYEKGKDLWKKQLAKFPHNLNVMEHAVNYLEINDPEEAERLILEMMQNDRKYLGRLGELYARAILGITAADYRTGKPTQADARVADSRFARRASATLQASSNEILISSVRRAVADYDPRIRVGGGPPPDLPAVFRPGTFLPATPQRIRVGGNVMQTKLVHQPKPIYPLHAKQSGVSGVVRLNAIIGKDGTIQNLTVASGNPELAQAAMEAVKEWVYVPTLLSGKPVEVVTQIDVNFTLSQ